MNEPLTPQEIARAQLPRVDIPQLKGVLTAEQYARASAAGLSAGAGESSLEPRQFPYGKVLDSSALDGTSGFAVDGPFGGIIAIYVRNPLDVPFAFLLSSPEATSIGELTVGPASQRRLEFYTPTGSVGRIQSMWVVPRLLATPTEHGSIYFEVEP